MKYAILGAFMICLLSASKIYGLVPKPKNDFYNVINRYINSIVTSDYKELRNILDENLRVKIPHLNQVMIFNKATFVDHIKSRNGWRMDVRPRFLLIGYSEAVTIVQGDFKYDNTVMQNFIFIEKNHDNEWKISQIYEIFKTVNILDSDSIDLRDSMMANK